MMTAKDIVQACSDAGEPALASALIAGAATAEAVAKRLQDAADIRSVATLARNMLPDLEDAAIDELVIANIPADQARMRLLDTVVDAHEDSPEISNKLSVSEPDAARSWDTVIERHFPDDDTRV